MMFVTPPWLLHYERFLALSCPLLLSYLLDCTTHYNLFVARGPQMKPFPDTIISRFFRSPSDSSRSLEWKIDAYTSLLAAAALCALPPPPPPPPRASCFVAPPQSPSFALPVPLEFFFALFFRHSLELPFVEQLPVIPSTAATSPFLRFALFFAAFSSARRACNGCSNNRACA